MNADTLKRKGYEAVARSLREFGYPDASGLMVKETHEALLAGKRGMGELPHGVISMFAESQMRERPDVFGEIPR